MKKVNSNSCLICKSRNLHQLMHIKKFPLFFGAIPRDKKGDVEELPLIIAYCLRCGHVQQVELIDEEIMNRVYDAEYYNCPSPVSTGMGLREIEKFHSFFTENNLRKGKLLEVACFDGFLLREFQNDGWDVYGCDPSPMTVIAEKLIGKAKIKNEYFCKSLYTEDSFDCIVFRNLLEHIFDLHEFMTSVSYSLKEGGHIFIDVPNIKTYEPMGGFGMFFHQHVSYFSNNSIRNLLSLHGYQIEREFNGNPNLFIQAVKTGAVTEAEELEHITIGKQLRTLSKKQTTLVNEIKLYFDDNDKTKIALFGASALATSLISILDNKQLKKIAGIFDNDIDKENKELNGLKLPIATPSQLNLVNYDSILITTYLFDEEIYKQLIDKDCPKEKITSINEFV